MFEGGSQFYWTDALGSVRMRTSTSGSLLEAHDYYPFGQDMIGRSSAGAPVRQGFTGYWRDHEAGLNLYYAGARQYDPATGRFFGVDPLAEDFPTWSGYAYTLNDPVRWRDPDGRSVECPESECDGVVLHLTISGPMQSYHSSIHYYNRETGERRNIAEGMPENRLLTSDKSGMGWGKLIKDRVSDPNIPNNDIRISVPTPKGMTTNEFVNNIENNFNNYSNSIPYEALPRPMLLFGLSGNIYIGEIKTGNSNSLVGTVLRLSGSNFVPPHNVPGWGVNVV